MTFKFIRTLRAPSSERFLIQSETGQDLAGLDVHYLENTSVAGTLIILNDAFTNEVEIEALLQFVDESLLPMASLDEKNLSFTVLRGQVVGQFANEK